MRKDGFLYKCIVLCYFYQVTSSPLYLSPDIIDIGLLNRPKIDAHHEPSSYLNVINDEHLATGNEIYHQEAYIGQNVDPQDLSFEYKYYFAKQARHVRRFLEDEIDEEEVLLATLAYRNSI
ncbi:hypothetical protein K7432_015748 [Basidiobolus ranarum]|uniref:Uncharacterized protein n=1 Tax=Basidiobolus ranarum TaxID=34480 RepID=A0ABR2WFR9_9FUNG